MVEQLRACRVPTVRPLAQAQVDAANRLYKRIEGWRATDKALHRLRESFPGNTCLAEVLLKVAALNSLYNTNVFAVVRMAKHIVKVFERHTRAPDIEVVDEIAELPAAGEKKRRFLSFASKYCRFFVEPEQFAIYDTIALEALQFHLGPDCVRLDTSGRITYAEWLRAINVLRDSMSPKPSYVELDR